jgi:hypothetical protein
MRLRPIGLALVIGAATVVVTPSTARATLIINEVVFNEVGSDVTGEWIEIYNKGDAPISLANFKIGDEETSGQTSLTEALYQFPSDAEIDPGEIQIVAVSATRFFTVYGVNPTYEASSTDPTVPDMTVYATWDTDGGAINMANTNDQAVLVDGTDAIIDAASWGTSTFAFDPPLGAALDGQSYERINAQVDTDTASDWQATPGDTAAARSTPFAVQVPEPGSIGLLAGAALLGLARRRRRRG